MTQKIYEEDDGWNEDYFRPLLGVQDNLNEIGYEIRNCVRQKNITQIKDEIQGMIETLQGFQEGLEYEVEGSE